MALAIDVNVSTNFQNSTSNFTVSSPSFTTAQANELLLAFCVSSGGNNAAGSSVSSVSGAGLTWTLVVRKNAQAGTAEVWRAFAATALTSQTVSATFNLNGSSGGANAVTVVSFAGADATGTGGSGAIGATNTSSSSSGAPTCSITTTRSGSWVWGVGCDWDNATARTIGANQTLVHENRDSSTGDDVWLQRQTSTTPASGTVVTINDTAPTGDQYNLAIVEVLPSVTATATPNQYMGLLGVGAF